MTTDTKTQPKTTSRMEEIITNSPLPTEQTLKTVEMAKKPVEFAKKPVLQIKNNQIVAGILGTSGFVMFALGIEGLISTIPELSSPIVEIVLGLIMLSLSGLFLKKLT